MSEDRNVQKSARPQKTEALGLAAPEGPEAEARVEGRGGRTLGEEPDRARRQQSGLGFGAAGDLGALRSRLWPKSAPPLSGRTPAWGRFPLRVGNGCFHKNWVTPSCDRYWAGTCRGPRTLFLLQKNASFAFRGSSRNALRQEGLRQTRYCASYVCLGLLDDYLEGAKHFKPHGFSCDKAKASSSEWLAVDGLVSFSDNSKEDAFSGTDWMVEKMDLREFDFNDTLLSIDDLETMPDELLATLDDTCGLFDPLLQETNKEPPQIVNPIGHLPESLPTIDQGAPFIFLQPLPPSPGALSSTPDHSFSLELCSEVVISEGDSKPDSTTCSTVIPQSIKEEDAPSDDSGLCMSPDSSLGSPQHSPSTSRGSPNKSLLSPGALGGSSRPKPYDPPGEMVGAKVKDEKLDKKLQKMEQNKTAAIRYRQNGAEQEALAGECNELEKKNEALKEKADSLAKEIQYLKDLIKEVRKAREKKRVP
nr:cyclic AMP-dependent transcription factor ATF-4-like [Odocoileus virginianus texanus]